MGKKIRINLSDLPIEMQLIGDHGEQKGYLLRPAGRKFGAFLDQTDEQRKAASSDRFHQR